MKNLLTYAAIALAFVAYNAMTSADRDESGAIVSAGNVGAFQIQIGDCFDDTNALSSGETGEVSDLPGVPCARPHDNEVFAVFDLNISSFPEGNAMSELVFESCMGRFQSFVGTDYESSALDIMTLYPSRESWKLKHDREVVCAVYDMEAKKLEGSARGLACYSARLTGDWCRRCLLRTISTPSTWTRCKRHVFAIRYSAPAENSGLNTSCITGIDWMAESVTPNRSVNSPENNRVSPK